MRALPAITAAGLLIMLGFAGASPGGALAASPDWAGSGFCATGAPNAAPYTGNSYDGVAACGTAYGDNGNSNEQGPVTYDGVQFDSVGFQCVELVMRYMYYDFGVAPYSANGNTVVSNYHGSTLTKETNPAADGLPSVGDVLSFAGTSSNPFGHTSIVIEVSNSSLTTLNENDTANGLDTVPVDNGIVQGGVTGWLHAPGGPPSPKHANYDINGDGTSDFAFLTGVNGAATGSGHLEVHGALGPNFSTRIDFATPFGYLNTATALPFFADVNGDGKADMCFLIGLNGGTTGSGHLEVHCALGPNFSTRIDFATPFGYLNTATALPFFADVNGDGKADMCFLIGLNGGTTGSGHLEVHCALGPNFSTRIDFATPFGYLNTATALPFFADVNGDGKADMCFLIGLNGGTTGSGHLEVHCALGPNFSTRIDFATPFGYLNTATALPFFADVNGDGKADMCFLIGLNGGTTGSGHLEVHCALGPNFSTRIDFATPFGYLNTATALPFFADVNGDGKADMCFLIGLNGGTTGSGHLEVHCALGPNFSTRIDFATPFGYLNSNTNLVLDGVSPILRIAKSRAGSGTVTSTPVAVDCGSTCSHSYPTGTSVTLKATPVSGSRFAGWSGACTGTAACKLTMTSDVAVTASFSKVTSAKRTLTVTRSGSGAGTVTSSPAGINCGSTCSHSYSNGTRIALKTTAASGSTFAGWSGACSGSAACTVTMSAGRSVQAGFLLDCVVPALKGKNLGAATKALISHGCSLGKIKRVHSGKVKKGQVISQRPRPHQELKPGAKINLTISKGKH